MPDLHNRLPATLMVTATFPPRGGSGVQRAWYQAKRFVTEGIDLSIVTEDVAKTWVSDVRDSDEALMSSVFRCRQDRSRLLRGLSRLASKLIGTTIYPDSHWQWILPAFRRCRQILREKNIQLLLVSFGHPSALIVAAIVKRQNPDITLVVDVRDLWVGNPNAFSYVRNRGVLGWCDRRIERWAFEKADHVVGVSLGVIEELRDRYQWLNDDNVHVVQNGFDGSLFVKSAETMPLKREGPNFTFRHVGFVGPSQNLDVFFRAICRLKSENAELLSNVRFEFIGGNPEYVRQLSSSIGVDDVVECTGYVEHREAVKLMSEADVLLLFWGLGKGTVGGKTYEYLRANRFIMAFDQGNRDGRELLNETQRGEWVGADDLEGQLAMLRSIIVKLGDGVPLLAEPLVSVEKYSRESQNARLMEVLSVAVRKGA